MVKNFFIGLLAGVGNIMPGLSGSALLIIFKLYDKIIKAISNIFKDFKKSFLFLLPIGLGIILGTFIFSNLIEISLTKAPVITSIVFVGFMMGTLPSLFTQATSKGFKKKYLIFFLITFTIGCLFLVLKDVVPTMSENTSFLWLILLGFILAFTMIIPGISGTVLLTILGMYQTYLTAINDLNLALLIPIALGFALGIFMLSKVINYFLNNFYGETFFAILGFTIATIPGLLIYPISSFWELLIGVVLALLAFVLTVFVTKKE